MTCGASCQMPTAAAVATNNNAIWCIECCMHCCLRSTENEHQFVLFVASASWHTNTSLKCVVLASLSPCARSCLHKYHCATGFLGNCRIRHCFLPCAMNCVFFSICSFVSARNSKFDIDATCFLPNAMRFVSEPPHHMLFNVQFWPCLNVPAT